MAGGSVKPKVKRSGGSVSNSSSRRKGWFPVERDYVNEHATVDRVSSLASAQHLHPLLAHDPLAFRDDHDQNDPSAVVFVTSKPGYGEGEGDGSESDTSSLDEEKGQVLKKERGRDTPTNTTSLDPLSMMSTGSDPLTMLNTAQPTISDPLSYSSSGVPTPKSISTPSSFSALKNRSLSSSSKYPKKTHHVSPHDDDHSQHNLNAKERANAKGLLGGFGTVAEERRWQAHKERILKTHVVSAKIRVDMAFMTGQSKAARESNRPVSFDKTRQRLEQLKIDPDMEKGESGMEVSQGEITKQIRKYHVEMQRAWRNNERAAALTRAVRCARLLCDTKVPQFYPRYGSINSIRVFVCFLNMFFDRICLWKGGWGMVLSSYFFLFVLNLKSN